MADAVPLYDPDVHGDPNTVVRVEMWCACGGCWRQVDPVSYVIPQIASFREKHAGPHCRPAVPSEALAEREARREAAHRARGVHHTYTPGHRPSVDDAHAFDWSAPDEAAPGEEG